MNSDNKIYQTVRHIVEQELAPAHVVDLMICEDVDYDNEPILRITVVFDAGSKQLNPEATLGLGRHLREPLQKIEENRFPIFTFITPEEVDGEAA